MIVTNAVTEFSPATKDKKMLMPNKFQLTLRRQVAP
jgi:hypothetical protein